MEAPAVTAAAPRSAGLDVIRAAAIAWVMIYHGSLYDLTSQSHWLVRFGWMGVDLFFVLSGFLIAGQLLRPWSRGGPPRYGRFFTRRLLRTLPAYLAVLAVYFLIPPARDRPDIQPLWQFLTFTENLLFDTSTPKAFSHVWSLCVEEQFYLLFPAAVALLALRPSPRVVVGALTAVVLLGIGLRGYLWLRYVAATPFELGAQPHGGAYMRLIYYPTWTRLDGLVMGIAAAVLQAFRPAAWARVTARPNLLLIAGGLGLVASTAFFNEQIAGFWPTVLGFPLLSLSIALLVMAGATQGSLISRYRVPGARALAAGAYSLYLSHKAVFHAVQVLSPRLPSWAQDGAFALALAGALGAGATLYWMVERPFLRLRERLEAPSPAPLVAAPAAE